MDVGNIQLFSWRNTGPHPTVQWSSVWAVRVLKYNHHHHHVWSFSPQSFLLWFCIEIPLYYYILHYTAQLHSYMENGKHSLFCTNFCNTRQLRWQMFCCKISTILDLMYCRIICSVMRRDRMIERSARKLSIFPDGSLQATAVDNAGQGYCS